MHFFNKQQQQQQQQLQTKTKTNNKTKQNKTKKKKKEKKKRRKKSTFVIAILLHWLKKNIEIKTNKHHFLYLVGLECRSKYVFSKKIFKHNFHCQIWIKHRKCIQMWRTKFIGIKLSYAFPMISVSWPS